MHVATLFLSHSGKQKPFVRRLYHALHSCGHISTFLDERSLLPAAPYPPDLEKNARGCNVGVLVLSADFLTSKWPMLELQIMKESPSQPKLMPLFYLINPDDLKQASDCFTKCRAKWQDIVERDPSVDISTWADNLVSLRHIGGVVYHANDDEDQYIKQVCQKICTIISPPLLYDKCLLEGREIFVQEIAATFKEIETQARDPTILGLHASAGKGKTTLCKLMANYYMGYYTGRSTVMEFPSDMDGSNMKIKILELCKAVLQRLTDVDDTVLRRVHDLDQVPEMIGHCLRKHDVFLAMDNVSESSLQYASKILQAEFSAGSKILVTSQSQAVLSKLLSNHLHSRVHPLPTVESSFGYLPELDREILADVALLYIPMYVSDHKQHGKVDWAKHDGMSSYNHLTQWLIALNKGKIHDESEISKILKRLTDNGFMKFEDGVRQDSTVCLDKEFCAKVAAHEAANSRFLFLSTRDIWNQENMRWAQVERVALNFDIYEPDDRYALEEYMDIMNSEQGILPKLQLLWIDVIATTETPVIELRLRMECMPALRMLVLRGCTVDADQVVGWENAANMAWQETTSTPFLAYGDDSKAMLTRRHVRACSIADMVLNKIGRSPSLIKSVCINDLIIKSLILF